MKVRCEDCTYIVTKKHKMPICTNLPNKLYLSEVLGQIDIAPYCKIFNKEGDCNQYQRIRWKFWVKK